MRFEVHTTTREQLIDITDSVVEHVRASGVSDGAVLVFCPHTTAGVTINENADPDVRIDLVDGLARLAPRAAGWRHSKGNSDGHLKTSLVGPSTLVPIDSGALALGRWQGIYLCEFDGPRTRRVNLTVLPGVR